MSEFDNVSFYQVKNPSWEYFRDNVAPDYLKLTNRNVVEQQNVFAFAARDEFGFVGNMFFTPSPGSFDTYRMIQIKIVLEYRERGLGTAFYNYAAAELKKAGVNHIETFCMEDEAEEYLPFLKKNSFVKKDDAYFSKYTTEQIRKVSDDLSGSASENVVKMADLSAQELYKYLHPANICIDGMDRSISALLISDDRYTGIASLNCVDGEPQIDGVFAQKELIKPKDILAIWKYVVDTVIELAENSINNVEFIEVPIYQFKDNISDIFGTPVEKNVVKLFSKEL